MLVVRHQRPHVGERRRQGRRTPPARQALVCVDGTAGIVDTADRHRRIDVQREQRLAHGHGSIGPDRSAPRAQQLVGGLDRTVGQQRQAADEVGERQQRLRAGLARRGPDRIRGRVGRGQVAAGGSQDPLDQVGTEGRAGPGDLVGEPARLPGARRRALPVAPVPRRPRLADEGLGQGAEAPAGTQPACGTCRQVLGRGLVAHDAGHLAELAEGARVGDADRGGRQPVEDHLTARHGRDEPEDVDEAGFVRVDRQRLGGRRDQLGLVAADAHTKCGGGHGEQRVEGHVHVAGVAHPPDRVDEGLHPRRVAHRRIDEDLPPPGGAGPIDRVERQRLRLVEQADDDVPASQLVGMVGRPHEAPSPHRRVGGELGGPLERRHRHLDGPASPGPRRRLLERGGRLLVAIDQGGGPVPGAAVHIPGGRRQRGVRGSPPRR